MSRRVLVTGGYGFVGSAFTAQARAVGSVTRIARTRQAHDDIVWDLTDARYPRLPESYFLVHIASLTAKQSDDATSVDDYRFHNVVTTRNLLAALPSAPSYVLYVSTADVYGQGAREPITEETAPRPQTPYAESKLEAERVMSSFCESRGIPLGVARLGPIYGPGEAAYRKVIPTFISLALAGEQLPILGRGGAKRQYLYVDDLARALVLMVRLETPGVVNLAGSTVVTVAEVAQLIIEVSRATVATAPVPSVRPEVDVLFDTTRLAGLGFAEAVSLAEGLRQEIDWYRGRPGGGAPQDARPV